MRGSLSHPLRTATVLCTLIPMLSGCLGVAVGRYGTSEETRESFRLTPTRNQFAYGGTQFSVTPAALVESWGEPDETGTLGRCEVMTYYHGRAWEGPGAMLLFIPIPLMGPSGYKENRFYFIDNRSVGMVREYGEVTEAYGYLCYQQPCDFELGNTRKSPARAEVPWCQ